MKESPALYQKILFTASALMLLGGPVYASPTTAAYIKESQALLDSLPVRDSGRMALTLRLADAYFDEALSLSSGASPDNATLVKDRRRASELYEEALTGLNGVFPQPAGDEKEKIQFQLSRIYSDEGRVDEASSIWEKLTGEDTPVDIRRDAALRLADALAQKSDGKSQAASQKYYDLALGLCGGQDVCSYIHYRLAWLDHQEGDLKVSLQEMQKALWDSKGQIREEALRDLMTFYAGIPGDDGHEAFENIEGLAAKLHRAGLKLDLAQRYFSAGNRKAGVYVLELANKTDHKLENDVRLLEEYYGFRDWEKFRDQLEKAKDFHAELVKKGDASWKANPETEKILRRLTVQLDGERLSQKSFAADFENTVMFYLSLYPDSKNRSKMIDGWLAAQDDGNQKIARLQVWIGEERASGDKTEEIRLRQIRASEAQRLGRYDVVAEEMGLIAGLAPSAEVKRESTYQMAYAFYKSGKDAEALPLFEKLAQIQGASAPDKWAVQSENLALDILGREKNYKAVYEQAQAWTNNPDFNGWISKNPDSARDLKDLGSIALNARFEMAVTEGDTPAALAVFRDFCEKGLLTPKSCANAEVLAYKLKDEPALIAVLQREGKTAQLNTELEMSGRFDEAAAHLRGTLDRKSDLKAYLKVALLYELSGDLADRDQILNNMIEAARVQKGFGPEETLVFETLKDARLLDKSGLKWPWKSETRLKLASYLESQGRGNAETSALLAGSCTEGGEAWERIALNKLKSLDEKQRKISFTGRQSKRKFVRRIASLKALVNEGNCYLQGASARGRVVMATLLAKSHSDLASEIEASPIPSGLKPDVVDSLKKSLNEMAAPFMAKAKTYQDLAQTELNKIANPLERLALKQKLEGDAVTADLLTAEQTQDKAKEPQAVDPQKRQAALALLNRNPNGRGPLTELKNYYDALGQSRLSAYFQGRLNQLESQR